MRTLILLALLCVGAAVTVDSQPRAVPQGGAVPQWSALPAPAAVGSMAPKIAVEGGRAILSWIEGSGSMTSLKFAERTPPGWSAVRVAASGDRLMANAADVPSVFPLDGTSLAAAWLEKNGADPEAYDIRLAWSKDGGRTWSTPTSPHHDGTQTQHGFVSLFRRAGGGLGLVWLDGRAFQTLPSPAAPASMALRATTFAADGTQGPEAVVDTRVCDCCPVSTAATADGVIVAFRDRTGDEVRDISVSRLSGRGWTPAVRVHQDGWRITACPVNGPALSALNKDVAVAWNTVQQGRGRTLVAFSRDSGRSFGAPVRVDDEQSMGRPQVALLDGGSAAVSWIEFADGRSQFRLRRIERTGTRSPAATIADGMGAQHPRLARHGDELILAWVENTRGSTRVRTALADARANFKLGRKN